jgi:CubicO group peptidase (beta-lactamase class C family)
MQDYRVEDMQYLLQQYSSHPSYSFRISARDLARFGLLYLRHGLWKGQNIVPSQWVQTSTTLHAQTSTGPGFGYLWWVCSQGHLFLDLLLSEGAYASYGFGGQYLLVIPSLDTVIVHMGDPTNPDYRPPTVEQTRHLLQLILYAAPEGQEATVQT